MASCFDGMQMTVDASMKLWMWISLWMVLVACGTAAAGDGHQLGDRDGDGDGDVMAYWQSRLPGTAMPAGLRALVPPLSSSQASQFLADQNFLPAHAAAFCESARLDCEHGGLRSEGSDRHIHVEKKPSSSSAVSLENRPAASSPEAPHFLDLYSYQGSGIETLESHSKARLLSSGHVHEFSNAFFLEKQVFVRGSVVHVKPSTDNAGVGTSERAFLPRKLAKLFPIAGTDGSMIASKLGVSKEALQETLEFCEGKHAEDEACFTSMEDVADFVWGIAGRGSGSSKVIQVYDSISSSSEVTNAGDYFVVEDVKVLKGRLAEPSVSCHDLNFPFRVFYCHSTNLTRMFEVTVRGEDGSLYEQTVVCHYDTSYWNPKHFAMVLLHVKPGESEVCHFMGTTWLQPNGWIFVRGGAAAASG